MAFNVVPIQVADIVSLTGIIDDLKSPNVMVRFGEVPTDSPLLVPTSMTCRVGTPVEPIMMPTVVAIAVPPATCG